jgi:hypothetical protein
VDWVFAIEAKVGHRTSQEAVAMVGSEVASVRVWELGAGAGRVGRASVNRAREAQLAFT